MDQLLKANNDQPTRGSAFFPPAEQFIPDRSVPQSHRSLFEVANTQQSNRVNEIQRQWHAGSTSDVAKYSTIEGERFPLTSSMMSREATLDATFPRAGIHDENINSQNTSGAASLAMNLNRAHEEGLTADIIPIILALCRSQHEEKSVKSFIIDMTANPGNRVRPSGHDVENSIARIFSPQHSPNKIWKCAYCKYIHPLESCLRFLNKSYIVRKEILAQGTLCFRCLRTDHYDLTCRSNILCCLPGCRLPHHGFVHDLLVSGENLKPTPFRQEILPVLVYHEASKTVVLTHAYLTPLIRNAVCSNRLAEKLRLSGNKEKQFGVIPGPDGVKLLLRLVLRGVNMNQRYVMLRSVAVVKKLFDVTEHILENGTAKLYSKIFDIQLTVLEHTDIDLMIGFEVLGMSLDSGIVNTRNDSSNHPLPNRRLSPLGWSLLGRDYRLARKPVSDNIESISSIVV